MFLPRVATNIQEQQPASKERGQVAFLATHKSNAKRDKIRPKGGVKWTSRPGPDRLNSIMRNRPSQLQAPVEAPVQAHRAIAHPHKPTRHLTSRFVVPMLCPEAQAIRTSGRKQDTRPLGTKE